MGETKASRVTGRVPARAAKNRTARSERVARLGLLRRSRAAYAESERYEKIVFWAMVLTPFSSAFTLNIGQTIRATDVLLVLAIAVYVLFARKQKVALVAGHWLLLALAGVVLFATSINVLNLPPTGGAVSLAYPSGITSQSVVYGALSCAVIAMAFVVSRTRLELIRLGLTLSIWLAAAATIFRIVLNDAGQGELLTSLGFASRYSGVDLEGGGGEGGARQGPFLLGQEFGFYSGFVLIICLRERAIFSALVAAYCIWTSQSTTAVVGLAAAVVLALLLAPRAVLFFFGIVASLVGIVFVISNNAARAFMELQLSKLGLTNSGDASILGSLDLRSLKTEVGLRMMGDHVFGVGPNNFGAYFYDYDDIGTFPAWYYNGTKVIAENVYAQIGAENGVIALLIFVGLLAWLLLKLIRRGDAGYIAIFGFYAISIATQAVYTYPMVFIFLGVLIGRAAQANAEVVTDKPVVTAPKRVAAMPWRERR